MGDFLQAEKADMHSMYGRSNGDGRVALRMYHVQFPDPRMPDHIIRQLRETELLQDVPIAIPNRMLLQYDGVSGHFSTDVRTYLNATFTATRNWEWWTNPLAFPISQIIKSQSFFIGHLKNLVYATALDSDENLAARISEAAVRVRETRGIFERVRHFLHRRFQASIATTGRNFEHLL
ncbi:uncharacterized protein TNCV_3151261 [Trichonephila clavipes]|nr:uncharacterized protein TNCV_3151261 [Trichonephila clavipes]